MNRDDIIRMAREAGFGFMTDKPKSATHMQCGIDDLERFATLVASAEREEWANEFAGLGEWTAVHILEDREAIRARGQA